MFSHVLATSGQNSHTHKLFFYTFLQNKVLFFIFFYFLNLFIYYFSPLQHRVSVNLKDDWTSEG